MRTVAAIGGLALSLGAMLALPAHAAPDVDTAGASQCKTRGYLSDKDPKGTNVRAAPNGTALVIGHLPAPAKMKDDDEIVAVEVDIIGAKNGWLLIRNPDRGTLKRPGWVFGGLVSATIGTPRLLAAPSENAKVISKLQYAGEEGVGPDSFEVKQIHGCQGHYVEVTVSLAPSIKPFPGLPKQPMRGWVEKICSTQLTTCDPSF